MKKKQIIRILALLFAIIFILGSASSAFAQSNIESTEEEVSTTLTSADTLTLPKDYLATIRLSVPDKALLAVSDYIKDIVEGNRVNRLDYDSDVEQAFIYGTVIPILPYWIDVECNEFYNLGITNPNWAKTIEAINLGEVNSARLYLYTCQRSSYFKLGWR